MEKFFYKEDGLDISLDVMESVYYPDDDSVLLASCLLEIKGEFKGKKVLEIGCGSGFLSIIMAKFGSIVTSVDINEDAVKTTESNAKANNVNITPIQSDLFSNENNKFDFIIFNTPYLPDTDHNINDNTRKQWSLHQNGNVIEKFIEHSKDHLNVNGKIIFLFSSLSGDVFSVLENNGFAHTIMGKKKLDFEELMVVEGKLK